MDDVDTERDILQIQHLMDDFGHAPTASNRSSQRVYNPFDDVQNDFQGDHFQEEEFPAFEGEFMAQGKVVFQRCSDDLVWLSSGLSLIPSHLH